MLLALQLNNLLESGGGGPDTTPDAFSFTDQTGVPRSSIRTSNAITVAGINAATIISVSGGSYDINGSGLFTSSSGIVNSGDTVRARHTSSASFSTATNTAITIGGVSDTFTSTTEAGVSTPNVVAEAEATAISDIEAVSLVAAVTRAYSGSVANGNVISQNPAASTTVDTGSTITIVVSKGAAPVVSGKRGWTYGFGFGFGKRQ